MSRIYGEALGEEALYRGKDMILGPGVKHLPHASQRPQLRVYGRRSVPGKHHGSAVYSGIAV